MWIHTTSESPAQRTILGPTKKLTYKVYPPDKVQIKVSILHNTYCAGLYPATASAFFVNINYIQDKYIP